MPSPPNPPSFFTTRLRLWGWIGAFSPRRTLIAALLDDPGGTVALLDRGGHVLLGGGRLHARAGQPPVTARLASPAPALLRAALAAGQPFSGTGRLDATPVAIALHPVRAGPVAAILRLSDRTRECDLDEALGQSQRLQDVGELAGGMAHDFNNLLTAILGAADDLADHATAADRPDLDQIRASATRGADLVRQLLAFSQRQTLQPRVLVLDEAVANAASLLRRLLGTRVQLLLDLNAPGRLVHMDATQFDQVLMNLAINARNAMPDGGTITIITGWRLVLRPEGTGAAAVPPGRYATIDLTDTGTGMAPDIVARIFDPFFTTRRGEGGTGLGLSMVQGIVRQSGGYLAVSSTPGQGTSFRITLPRHEPVTADSTVQAGPAAPAPAPLPPFASVAPTPQGAGRILLVDDDDAVRTLAARSLTRAGLSVLQADCAEAALQADLSQLDCVVSDVAMPGMDGVGLVRALRALSPALPAVLMSGYADAQQRRALAAEDIAFLPKPFPMAELTRTVMARLPCASAAG